MSRIEAVRRIFPQLWIDSDRCEGGLEALGWYHEKIDKDRRIGLGPDHDWSSHAADAMGLLAIYYETRYHAGNTGSKSTDFYAKKKNWRA